MPIRRAASRNRRFKLLSRGDRHAETVTPMIAIPSVRGHTASHSILGIDLERLMSPCLDAETVRAAGAFLQRLVGRYAVSRAILFGSRARDAHGPESDADIAVILPGQHSSRVPIALDMAVSRIKCNV